MAGFDFIKRASKLRLGRRRQEPQRETYQYPNLVMPGRINAINGLVYKPTPRNLRYFSRTPMARRAINAIKDPIKMLEWEISPLDGVDWNSELKRQAEIATFCFMHPNDQDDFGSMCEQLTEDFLIGGGALETQIGGDQSRPLFMWPSDGLSIQIYAEWDGKTASPRYAQTIGYGSQFGGGQLIQLRNDELLYLRPNKNTATPFGFGPLEIAFDTISNLLSVGQYAGLVAGNRHPSIGLDFPGKTDAELTAYRAYWRNNIEGQGNIPMFASTISGDGKKAPIEVLKLYPEGDEGLYLQYQEMLKRELGCAFNLSPQNFGIERDVNRNTSEVAEDRDWDCAIKPTAQDIAKAFTRHCIHDLLGFTQLRFRFVGLDREDEKVTMEIMKLRYETNSITPNQINDRFGEPPMDSVWGDMTYADYQIAMKAAQGAKEVDDPQLTGQGGAQASAATTSLNAPLPRRVLTKKKKGS